jgi:hypothetical protein
MMVPTSALVELLEQFDPDAISRLRRQHPTASRMLSRGKILGTEDGNSGVIPALKDLVEEGLRVAHERATSTWKQLDRRVRRAMRVRLAGGLLSTAASAGVVGALILAQSVAALTTALLAFASSALVLVAQYLEDSGGHSDRSPRVAKDNVSKIVAELSVLDGDLRLYSVTQPDQEAWENLTKRANALVSELKRIEFDFRISA